MVLLLTQSISTGDLDNKSTSYKHLKIVKATHNAMAREIKLQCQFGNESADGKWESGIIAAKFYYINDKAYDDILLAMPQKGETAYQSVSRALYQWLVDNGKYNGSYE